MTDDANSTDDSLADPAQVVPREPRSPVEAAADPAHGGGLPTFNQAVVQQAHNALNASAQNFGQSNPYASAMSAAQAQAASNQQPVNIPTVIALPDAVQNQGNSNTSSFEATRQAAPDADGVVPPNPKRQEPASSSPRTILSGVERLHKLKERAADLLHDAETFVLGMEGVAGAQDAESMEWMWSKSPDTAGRIHDAVFDMEGLFDSLAGVIKRAKAAHG